MSALVIPDPPANSPVGRAIAAAGGKIAWEALSLPEKQDRLSAVKTAQTADWKRRASTHAVAAKPARRLTHMQLLEAQSRGETAREQVLARRRAAEAEAAPEIMQTTTEQKPPLTGLARAIAAHTAGVTSKPVAKPLTGLERAIAAHKSTRK